MEAIVTFDAFIDVFFGSVAFAMITVWIFTFIVDLMYRV